MARVYGSSTIADLLEERLPSWTGWLRRAISRSIATVPTESLRESCLHDIDHCDLYILVLGHRYGFQPERDNPDNLSINSPGVPASRPVRHSESGATADQRAQYQAVRSDYPQRAELVRLLDLEVRQQVRPAEFRDAAGLIQGLSTGVQSELDKLAHSRKRKKPQPAEDPRLLKLLTSLTDERERKNRAIDESQAENLSLRGRVKELEEQLRAAVARILSNAGQPGASAASIAAVEALGAVDTRPDPGPAAKSGIKPGSCSRQFRRIRRGAEA